MSSETITGGNNNSDPLSAATSSASSSNHTCPGISTCCHQSIMNSLRRCVSVTIPLLRPAYPFWQGWRCRQCGSTLLDGRTWSSGRSQEFLALDMVRGTGTGTGTSNPWAQDKLNRWDNTTKVGLEMRPDQGARDRLEGSKTKLVSKIFQRNESAQPEVDKAYRIWRTQARFGRSGGLALLWRRDVKVEIQGYLGSYIDAIVTNLELEFKWRITGFYGHPETHRRRESWDILRSLNRQYQLPWLCFGDFNEIVSMEEKFGGARRSQRQMNDFREAIHHYSTSDHYALLITDAMVQKYPNR
uniref:Endonuclease/exonuclease/phosphatase domain-containing protein n=1 Tax=Quercus lobata TaxID=97700 RepID=A0A7N2KYU2_QUELO